MDKARFLLGGEVVSEAAKRLNCLESDLGMFSWPCSFGSTAGPRGGLGGCMVTDFQIYVFYDTHRPRNCAAYCVGVWKQFEGSVAPGQHWDELGRHA